MAKPLIRSGMSCSGWRDPPLGCLADHGHRATIESNSYLPGEEGRSGCQARLRRRVPCHFRMMQSTHRTVGVCGHGCGRSASLCRASRCGRRCPGGWGGRRATRAVLGKPVQFQCGVACRLWTGRRESSSSQGKHARCGLPGILLHMRAQAEMSARPSDLRTRRPRRRSRTSGIACDIAALADVGARVILARSGCSGGAQEGQNHAHVGRCCDRCGKQRTSCRRRARLGVKYKHGRELPR